MKIIINGVEAEVPAGVTVAAALAHAGQLATRRSLGGQPRQAFCGMGVCQECRVRIDGQPERLACMSLAVEGMQVETPA